MPFALREAYSEDASAMAQVMVAAYQDHPIWKRMMHCVPVPEQIDFVEETLQERFESSGTFSYTVIEDAYSRVVAWAGLKYPSQDCILDKERKAETTLPNGVDETAAKDFFEALSPPLEKYGYNPKEHGEWRGLVVHPAYQRRGLGGQLAAHRNDIAKRAGFDVYGVARATSRGLFIHHGAVVLGTYSVDMQKYNGSCPAHGQVYVMRQGPNVENCQETAIAKGED